MSLEMDIAKQGYEMFFRPYQALALRYLWRLDGEGASSRDVWVQVNEDLMGKSTISRASIINFLNDMVDEGALSFIETTGRGGYRRIYSSMYDEAGFKRYMANKIISRLLETWPEAARDAIRGIKGK